MLQTASEGVRDRLLLRILAGGSSLEGPSRTAHSPHTTRLRTNIPDHHRHTITAIASELPVATHHLLNPGEARPATIRGGQAARSGIESAVPTVLIVTTTRPRRTNVAAAARRLPRTRAVGSTSGREAPALSLLPLTSTISKLDRAGRRESGLHGLGPVQTQWHPVAPHHQSHSRISDIDHDQ